MKLGEVINLCIMLFSCFNLAVGQEIEMKIKVPNDSIDKIEKLRYIKSVLVLSAEETNEIRNDHELVQQLREAVADSSRIERTRSILDSFYLRKSDRKRLLVDLDLLIVFGPDKVFEHRDFGEKANVPSFNSAAEAKKYMDSVRMVMRKRMIVRPEERKGGDKDSLR